MGRDMGEDTGSVRRAVARSSVKADVIRVGCTGIQSAQRQHEQPAHNNSHVYCTRIKREIDKLDANTPKQRIFIRVICLNPVPVFTFFPHTDTPLEGFRGCNRRPTGRNVLKGSDPLPL